MATEVSHFDGFAAEVRGLFKKASEAIVEEEIQKAQHRIRERINKEVSKMVVEMASHVSLIDRQQEIVITVRKANVLSE